MIDAHAHLENEAFDEDRNRIIENRMKDGLDAVVNVGSDLETSKAVLALAEAHEGLYAVIGVHPHDATTYSKEVEDALRAMSASKKVVAIGEIGLDYYYDYSPKSVQREAFCAQFELAIELNLPVVIHSREAALETFEIVESYLHDHPGHPVLIHCYSYSPEMMERFAALGCYFSLGGVTTFKNAKTPKAVAKAVALDRLLLETDSPYMTPEPHRGKRNEPKYVRLVAENIARLREMDTQELIRRTDENAMRFYGFSI